MKLSFLILVGASLSIFNLAQASAGSLDPYVACANALNSEGLESLYSFSTVLSPAAKPQIPFVSTKHFAATPAEHKGKAGFFVYTPDRAFFFDPGLKPKEPLSVLVSEDSVCFKLVTPDRASSPLYLEFHASWDDPQQGYFSFIANEGAPVGFQQNDLKGGPKAQYARNAAEKCKPLNPSTELLNAQTRALLEKDFLARFLAITMSDFPKAPSQALVKEMETAMTACKSIEERGFRNSILSAEKTIRSKMPKPASPSSGKIKSAKTSGAR